MAVSYNPGVFLPKSFELLNRLFVEHFKGSFGSKTYVQDMMWNQALETSITTHPVAAVWRLRADPPLECGSRSFLHPQYAPICPLHGSNTNT